MFVAVTFRDNESDCGTADQIDAGTRTLTPRPAAVVAVARELDLGGPDLTLPYTPAEPEALLALATRWGLDGPLARLVDTLNRH